MMICITVFQLSFFIVFVKFKVYSFFDLKVQSVTLRDAERTFKEGGVSVKGQSLLHLTIT